MTVTQEPHTIVQSWIGVSLAEELKAQARQSGSSVSSLIREALEDYDFASSVPAGEGSAASGGSSEAPCARRSAAASGGER